MRLGVLTDSPNELSIQYRIRFLGDIAMSTGSIDRVQSDLNAMREALGLGPIWSMADVRSWLRTGRQLRVTGLIPLAGFTAVRSDALGCHSSLGYDCQPVLAIW